MRCSICVPENRILVEDPDGSSTCIGPIDESLENMEPVAVSQLVEARAQDFADLGFRVSVKWGNDTDFATLF